MSSLEIKWPCGMELKVAGLGLEFNSKKEDALDCPLHGQTCPNGTRPPRPQAASAPRKIFGFIPLKSRESIRLEAPHYD